MGCSRGIPQTVEPALRLLPREESCSFLSERGLAASTDPVQGTSRTPGYRELWGKHHGQPAVPGAARVPYQGIAARSPHGDGRHGAPCGDIGPHPRVWAVRSGLETFRRRLRLRGRNVQQCNASINLWPLRKPPLQPSYQHPYTSAQLKPTVFRDATPCRAYAIMRSKGESFSAGEWPIVWANIKRYQGTSARSSMVRPHTRRAWDR